MTEKMTKYLESNFYMDYDYPILMEKVTEITFGSQNQKDSSIALFNFVRDNITYNFAPDLKDPSDMKASKTLNRGNGFCTQKSILLAAMMRSIGIPSKIGFQDLRDYKLTGTYVNFLGSNILEMHGLAAIYINNHWIRIDATLDGGLVGRKGYRLTEFDGTHEALLFKTDRHDHPHFDILREYGFSHTLEKKRLEYYLKLFHHKDYEKWKDIVHKKQLSM